ncbi:Hypothetical predicted protein [Paramuricea clavata]|uniref:Uncharacterized protein n=1 Tax=Paramuricea clavata TaxID=317549 RepID=A0A7D9IWN1_PARCT|nr:Hypothetical predicted protein [Paramuricea clavata]
MNFDVNVILAEEELNLYRFRIFWDKVNPKRKDCRHAILSYQNQIRDLRKMKPKRWLGEIKQPCVIATFIGQDLQSVLRPDLHIGEMSHIWKKSIKIFASVIKDYCSFSMNLSFFMEDESLRQPRKQGPPHPWDRCSLIEIDAAVA